VVDALKPGGRLFTESDFTDDGHHAMHHLNADDPRGEKIWEGLGMIRENNEWWQKPEKILTGGIEND
jgi:hypothetical protein